MISDFYCHTFEKLALSLADLEREAAKVRHITPETALKSPSLASLLEPDLGARTLRGRSLEKRFIERQIDPRLARRDVRRALKHHGYLGQIIYADPRNVTISDFPNTSLERARSVIRGLKHGPSNVYRRAAALTGAPKSLSEAERRADYLISVLHEADESKAIRKAPVARFATHWSPEVILRESNLVHKLDPELAKVRDLRKRLRSVGESRVLKDLSGGAFRYGETPVTEKQIAEIVGKYRQRYPKGIGSREMFYGGWGADIRKAKDAIVRGLGKLVRRRI